MSLYLMPAALAAAMLTALEARYAELHRHYHTLDHITACFDELQWYTEAGLSDGMTPTEHATLSLAIWWHDAVYDPTRSDNEEESARLAQEHLAGITNNGMSEEVARLILLTKGHSVEPGDRFGALIVSIDLAVLGAAPDTYDGYATAIRTEYGHVPEGLYRQARADILDHFLKGVIYPDSAFAKRYDRQARCNISREIARLRA